MNCYTRLDPTQSLYPRRPLLFARERPRERDDDTTKQDESSGDASGNRVSLLTGIDRNDTAAPV